MPHALLFEHATCSRCGGSGSYSFNQVDGSRCYGCGGSGNKLTKRGSAAQEYFRRSLTVTTAELVVGDRVRGLRVTADCKPYTQWETVEAIDLEANGPTSARVDTKARGRPMAFNCSADSLWLRYGEPEERKAKIAEALAYQETLTKAGTPRKRRAKAAAKS